MDNTPLIDLMQAVGASEFPHEACGLVVKRGKKSVGVACKNASSDPKNHFLITPQEYAKWADTGEIVGVWHTHPNLTSRPSIADLASCEASELTWFIMGIQKTGDTFVFEEPTVNEPSGKELPYLERPYCFGALDCWSLARDYYRREFKIQMDDYPRIEKWWNKGHDFFGENFLKEGFVKMINQEPQVGDIFLIQMNSDVPNHIAIYIGDDMILHHAYGRLSNREIYGGYWHKHTAFHLRHKDLMK